MSKKALSAFLQRHMTFQTPPLQKALRYQREEGSMLVDALLDMHLLTNEQYQTLSRQFDRVRSLSRHHDLSEGATVPSMQTDFVKKAEEESDVFWKAMQVVHQALDAPEWLEDLPASDDYLDSFPHPDDLDSHASREHSIHPGLEKTLEYDDESGEVERLLASVELGASWEDEDSDEYWDEAEGDQTLPQVSFSRIQFSEEMNEPEPEQQGPLADRILSNTWVLTRLIGEGAMGVVYEGQNLMDGRVVALKILRESYQQDEEVLNRFCREASILQEIKHPNILEVYELGYDTQLGSYMVMEMLKGCDLDQFLKFYNYEIPIEEMIYIFGQVCDAMQYIHDEKIVHRDLKPENIFLSEQPDGFKHVTIVDFGIVKLTTQERQHFTQTGATLGTPQFVSPEQALGGSLDARSDVYSLGVIAFKALTGKDLFTADSPYEYLSHHIYTTAPRLSSVLRKRKVPRSLDKCLQKCLAKKKEDRYPSMVEMKEALLKGLDEYRENLNREGPSGVFQAISNLPNQIKSWGVRVFSSSTDNKAVSDTEVALREMNTEDELPS